MKIKPMTMLTAKDELALSDLDGTRKYLDEISYNIREIFHGNHSETSTSEYKSVDIAEHLMNAMDVLTYAMERLTHFQGYTEDLPKVNSSIAALRHISENIRKMGEELKVHISNEYYDLYTYKLDDLNEVVDDVERIFFVLPQDKEFMAAANRLFGLQ
jgi:hypothetical protein